MFINRSMGLKDLKSYLSYELVNHRIATRGNQSLIKLPKIRTEAGRKTSSYQGAKLFNELDLDMRNEQYFVNFKRKLVNFSLQ